jgi:hypothetical protein
MAVIGTGDLVPAPRREHIGIMASKSVLTPATRAGDLPTKTVRAADGTTVRVKVVQANSPTLDQDLLAAFRANVRRVKEEQRKRLRVVANSAQG